MTALRPGPALALAVRLLEEAGFAVSGRNTRGDSVYLRPADAAPALPFMLRVSNHARTPRQRRAHREVLTSLVIAQPRTAAQVRAGVEGALRDFWAATKAQDTLGRRGTGLDVA